VVTTYLVANAVSLTASTFLTQRLGRKTFFLICLALFTASSVLCAYASNLDTLLLFRIVQGVGGGGMVPVAQSILADSFPPESAARASRCLAWRSWWLPWSDRRSAAGSPTISRGAGPL
jgi:MFS transporter, DHA2 family, multidrug resistance protein